MLQEFSVFTEFMWQVAAQELKKRNTYFTYFIDQNLELNITDRVYLIKRGCLSLQQENAFQKLNEI